MHGNNRLTHLDLTGFMLTVSRADSGRVALTVSLQKLRATVKLCRQLADEVDPLPNAKSLRKLAAELERNLDELEARRVVRH
jgi:hypothetical protein